MSDTIEGHYVEILFWAEPEIYAKDLYVEQNPGKKSAFMATAWVTDELEVTECYLDVYNGTSRERAALGLEGKPYYDAAKESEHYAAKEIIEKKLAEFKNNKYGYTSKTFSDEEVWKIYDEYMTERLCSKETVKREDVIKKEVYETLDYTCTKVYNEKGILIEMPPAPWTESMYRELENIHTMQGLLPIVAHVDRYIRPFHTHKI